MGAFLPFSTLKIKILWYEVVFSQEFFDLEKYKKCSYTGVLLHFLCTISGKLQLKTNFSLRTTAVMRGFFCAWKEDLNLKKATRVKKTIINRFYRSWWETGTVSKSSRSSSRCRLQSKMVFCLDWSNRRWFYNFLKIILNDN